jgi:outer membrane protein W
MKKKLLLVAACAAFGLSAFAQRPVDANPFSLEGGLNLTGGSTFSAPAITLRYFAADNFAGRLGLMYSSNKTVDNYYGTKDFLPVADSLGTRTVNNSMTWVSIGGSYHFSQLDRLSPYAAVDIMIGSGSTNESWSDFDGFGFEKGVSAKVNTSNSGFGFKLAAGFDYYFAENVFIGAELGFMSMSTNDKGGEASFTSGSSTTTIKLLSQGNSSSFSNTATSAIRLGWRF